MLKIHSCEVMETTGGSAPSVASDIVREEDGDLPAPAPEPEGTRDAIMEFEFE